MRLLTIGILGLASVGLIELAWANPALLPKHAGYPSGGEFSYDRGQKNLTAVQSLLDAAESGSANIVQNLEDPNNAKELRAEGAGVLPIEQAPKTPTPVSKTNPLPKP